MKRHEAPTEAMLPGHIQAVKDSGVPVVWQCDGVHGNGVVASNKLKTRKLADIMTEIKEVREPHKLHMGPEITKNIYKNVAVGV